MLLSASGGHWMSMSKSQAFIIAAADTVMRHPSRELMATVSP
jgi:hypothetical protein